MTSGHIKVKKGLIIYFKWSFPITLLRVHVWQLTNGGTSCLPNSTTAARVSPASRLIKYKCRALKMATTVVVKTIAVHWPGQQQYFGKQTGKYMERS